MIASGSGILLSGRSGPPADMEVVIVEAGRCRLPGFLSMPEKPVGAVLFAHGREGSRFDRTNTFIAEKLQRAGFATLLLNLVTQEEREDPAHSVDLELLSERMVLAGRWLASRTRKLRKALGFFGARFGATVAVRASGLRGSEAGALVCLDGALHPVNTELANLAAPALFIVAEPDELVAEAHQALVEPSNPGLSLAWCRRGAARGLNSDKDRLGHLTADWYAEHLSH